MDGMTTTAQDVLSDVRSYIVDRFMFGQGGDRLGNEDSFLDRGLIDSTGILEVVSFLEQRYGIKVADDELVPDNLDSLTRIASFVARKQG
jgi:acyl carrier protein